MTSSPSNLLVLQGGGPTPVLNTSLAVILEEAQKSPHISAIFGARHGIEGLIKNNLVNLTKISASDIQHLKQTPGASLGTTRLKPSENEYHQILSTLQKNNVRHLILIGGNGSLRGAALIHQLAVDAHYDLHVIGCPKTIDNDIPDTDRCPGFGSAANYLAQSVRDLGQDVRALPQPVSIYETMGRSVGWLAAAAALAKNPHDQASAPHLIYLPELPFHPEQFLASVDRVVTKHNHCIVVVAEGLKKSDGSPVYQTTTATQSDALGRALPGGVATYLADYVTQNLKLRCRSEKPGLCGRASMRHLSLQDSADASHVARESLRASLSQQSNLWPSLLPLDVQRSMLDVGCFLPSSRLLPLPTAHAERHIPTEFLSSQTDLPITSAFLNYLRPLTGPLLDYPLPLKDTYSHAKQ
ncbi:MAG TPA: diphosphate--fructose-6-phosphate 1-phosphotransferase [Tepidisphaeraceae bacterium]|jgi:6-phosphofructokinase 1|nr:diphosphate--fructose-6-phosphate 1-phosphotransferase [Tepidisphaeraceae bacterium]